MSTQEQIQKELSNLPEAMLRELLHYLLYLKTRAIVESVEPYVLSESALSRDWSRPEEDEAWRDL